MGSPGGLTTTVRERGTRRQLDDIRRDLGTDLGALNGVLRELNRPMLTFEALHRAALRSYVEEHRVDTLDALRRRFRARFQAGADLSGYVTVRDFRDLTPDPAWLPEFRPDAAVSANTHETLVKDDEQELPARWLTARTPRPTDESPRTAPP